MVLVDDFEYSVSDIFKMETVNVWIGMCITNVRLIPLEIDCLAYLWVVFHDLLKFPFAKGHKSGH